MKDPKLREIPRAKRTVFRRLSMTIWQAFRARPQHLTKDAQAIRFALGAEAKETISYWIPAFAITHDGIDSKTGGQLTAGIVKRVLAKHPPHNLQELPSTLTHRAGNVKKDMPGTGPAPDRAASQNRHNFSGGPGALPESVLLQAQAAIVEVPKVGLSVLGISYRSRWFRDVVDEAE
jgi:hypothetical protein